ncbi:MAG: hypothetical protein Q8K63_09205 [Acidimicrobiales bacterium]|nr:hypothetical protein [Acidimicrobiales bacterium]
MKLRALAVVLAALGVIFVAAALLRPAAGPEPATLKVIADRFSIDVALADGSEHHAEVLCEGNIKGTGYLASADASFRACTFDSTVVVHRYLQSRADCAAIAAKAAELPNGSFVVGKATITGIYFDKPIEHRIDAVDGSDCDRAVWKLLAPLLPQ